jgi:hypothetical protein
MELRTGSPGPGLGSQALRARTIAAKARARVVLPVRRLRFFMRNSFMADIAFPRGTPEEGREENWGKFF